MSSNIDRDVGFLQRPEMPFIRFGVGGRGIDHWAGDCPTGYMDGWYYGERMALFALLVDPANCGPGCGALSDLLAQVACAQIESGTKTAGDRAAVLGFWRTIGRFAAAVARPSAITPIFAEIREREKALEAGRARDEEQRREQCRAGAAKRRKRREAAAKGKGASAKVVPIRPQAA